MFTKLLKTKTFDGYPDDFVLARIRGRGYCTPVSSAGAVTTRKGLDREYSWIFSLLNKKTTKTFTPFFSLFEVERLLSCLRLDRRGESSQVPQILSDSLLSRPAGSLIEMVRDPAGKLIGIMDLLEFPSDTRSRMERMLVDESWTDIEAVFWETYLKWATGSSRRKDLTFFFQTRVDMRNLLAMHKALRWQSEKSPPFIDEGSFPQSSLDRFMKADSLKGLEDFARRRLAQRASGNLEFDLIHGLAILLHRRARFAGGGPTMILSHLWNLYAGLRQRASERVSHEEVA